LNYGAYQHNATLYEEIYHENFSGRQCRRLWLHDGLTVRQIAEDENIKHQSKEQAPDFFEENGVIVPVKTVSQER